MDNFYIIEETYKTIMSEMDIRKYKRFTGITNGMYKGFSRSYVLASEIVAYTDNRIDDEILELAICSYQRRKLLTMEEIWNLWIFLEVALLENIRNICEKIYSAQIQKHRVESIIERLVEKKETKNQIFKNEKVSNKNIYEDMRYPFIEYMSYRLKRYGKQGLPYLEILEEQVNRMGMTISDAIKKEHYDIAILKVSLANSIMSLKEISRVNFVSLFEKINGIEDVLKKDPSKIYSKMDYKTKEYYRNEIKKISEKTKISELYIAKKIVELSNRYVNEESIKEKKKSHIGYYLISDGRNELLEVLGIKIKKHVPNMIKAKRYILSNYLLTIFFTVIFGCYFYYINKNIFFSIIVSVFMLIPISEIVKELTNDILKKKVKPKFIPKLDFQDRSSKKICNICCNSYYYRLK